MWSIQLFAGLAAHSPEREITRFRTHKAGALLAYLAFYNDRPPQSREVLADLFWPDTGAETGRPNLSRELTALRRLLETAGVPPGSVLQTDRFTVRLNPATVTTDVHVFEDAACRGLSDELSVADRLRMLAKAAECCQGPLLPGYYEEWIGPETTRLSSLLHQVLLRIVSLLLESGRAEQALEYANRAVAADSLSEESTAALLRVLAATGQPRQAMRVYCAYAKRLNAELHQTPSAELERLALRSAQSGAATINFSAAAAASGSSSLSVDSEGVVEETVTTAVVQPVDLPPAGHLIGGFGLLPTTRFFGREQEIARVTTLLSAPRTRLVTLIGAGGIGKTRLALEVVVRMMEAPAGASPTAAVFVPLADVREPERLYEAILRVLDGSPSETRSPLDQISARLALQPSILLILDNFEQLADKGALLVQELLARTSVKLLVTSRHKMRLSFEQAVLLSPLPTSSGERSVEELLQVASVALFVDRAQWARPEFRLTEGNAAVVAQLSKRLEGIPLAIELAAARVSVLSPASILDQVTANRLDFLASRHKDTSVRHRTLRLTLDWSYGLLPEAAQQFLSAVSVFRDGWTVEASQMVSDMSAEGTLELLMLLRDSSLIETLDTEDGLRFNMLDIIREYAEEQLERTGGRELACRRHAAYFADLAEGIVRATVGPDVLYAARRWGLEHDNLRAALAWAEQHGEHALDGRQGLAKMRGWFGASWIDLGRWMSGLLDELPADAPSAKGHRTGTPEADMVRPVSGTAGAPTDRDAAVVPSRHVASMFLDRGDRAITAWMLIVAGHQAMHRSIPKAAACFDESLRLMREVGTLPGIASALTGLCIMVHLLGQSERADALAAEARDLAHDCGDSVVVGRLLMVEGERALCVGDYARAKDRFGENLALRRRIGDGPGAGIALTSLGTTALYERDPQSARRYLDEAQTVLGSWSREAGYHVAEAHCFMGMTLLASGEAQTATVLARDALMSFRDMGSRFGVRKCLLLLADLAAAQGQAARATQLLGIHERTRDLLGMVLHKAEYEQIRRLTESLVPALGESCVAEQERIALTLSDEDAIAVALEETRHSAH